MASGSPESFRSGLLLQSTDDLSGRPSANPAGSTSDDQLPTGGASTDWLVLLAGTMRRGVLRVFYEKHPG